ncbi:ABC transporter permease [Streptomyces sp. NPDC020681]|uniref:ABC transporter permease n=1 Tax=Streptomyces sp. NPDC020681 TaxID=3365083 RepID=UPI0037B5397B
MMRRLFAAELGKLMSVRSTWILLAGTAVIAGLHAAGLIIGDPAGDLGTDLGKQRVLFSAGMGSLLAIVLGVLISAGEFRHGTITDTYLTTPRRGRVMVAKLGAGLLVGALAGLASAVTTLALSAPWLSARGDGLPLDQGYVWLTLLGAVIWCTAYAVIGVAVGVFTRNPVLGIVGALAWLYVIEGIVVSAFDSIGRWLPSGAAFAVGNNVQDGLLPQWGGAVMLTGYAAVIAVAAALTTLRRDVT